MVTNTASFQVFYDTEDAELTQHKIDAKILSISIGSMADLISAADKRFSGSQQTVKLIVTDPAETGSFDISYTMMELAPHAVNIVKVVGLIGLADAAIGASALSLIRQLESRKVISITKRAGANQSVLEFEGEKIVCHGSVAKLVTDPEIGDVLVSIVRALLDEKEDAVFKVLNEDDAEVVRLEDEEAEKIEPLPRGTLLEEEESAEEVNVRFVQINFEGTKGWRIEYLGEEYAVSFGDQLLIHQVQNGIVSLAKEDLFVIDPKTTKTFAARNASTKYVITKVKRRRPTEA